MPSAKDLKMKSGKLSRLLKDYLRKRDPQGYYVILIDKNAHAKILDLVTGKNDVKIEDLGVCLVVRLRSRSLARRVIESVAPEDLLDAC